MDYFDHYECTPPHIQALITEFEEALDRGWCMYDVCEKYADRFFLLGWSFEYGLDGTPYNLRPHIEYRGYTIWRESDGLYYFHHEGDNTGHAPTVPDAIERINELEDM